MSGQVTLSKGGPVVPPPAGFYSIFFDTDGTAKAVDSTGAVVSLGGGTALPSGSIAPTALNDQQMLISGLNGETDGGYTIKGYVVMPAGGGSLKAYTLRVNSQAPSGDALGSTIYFANTSITGDNGIVANAINLCYQGSGRSAGWFYFRVYITSKKGLGVGRQFECWSCRDDGQIQMSSGVWEDTSDAVTSLQIFGSAANTILAGSYLSWQANGLPGI